MVYLIGASSLYRAFENAPYSLKSSNQKRSFALSGLSFKPRSEKLKNFGYLLRQRSFKNSKNLVCWHDVINNSITKHKSNNYTACSLKQYTKNFIAIVYCQRFGTSNIHEDLRQLNIIIIDAKTKLLSKRKQNLPEFAQEIKNSTPGLYWSAILSQRFYENNQQSTTLS